MIGNGSILVQESKDSNDVMEGNTNKGKLMILIVGHVLVMVIVSNGKQEHSIYGKGHEYNIVRYIDDSRQHYKLS